MCPDLHHLQELAIEWAKEAGKIQLFYFRGKDLEIATKSNVSDVVTKVDKLCEAFLVEQIRTYFPDHSILGEESGIYDRQSDYQWVIDPLDGTNNYSQGLPIFTISIGLKYKEERLLGVVYAPYLNELYTAIRGEGAYFNGLPLHVSSKIELRQSVLATGFPYDKDTHPVNNIDNFACILPSLRGIRRYGSAAYDLCCVSAGYLDAYWELGLKEWDVCAGILIVEEAGGVIYHFREDRGIALIAGPQSLVEAMKNYIR